MGFPKNWLRLKAEKGAEGQSIEERLDLGNGIEGPSLRKEKKLASRTLPSLSLRTPQKSISVRQRKKASDY